MTVILTHKKFEIPRWDFELYRGDTRLIDLTIVNEERSANLQAYRLIKAVMVFIWTSHCRGDFQERKERYNLITSFTHYPKDIVYILS